MNLDVLESLKSLHLPVLTHVRELESTISDFGGASLIANLNQRTTRFVADSRAVRENLMCRHSIDVAKIDVVDEYVMIPDNLPGSDVSSDMRTQLNIPQGAFVVGACGGGLWRKGYDLFISVAISVLNQSEPGAFSFVWIGGIPDDVMERISMDISNAGYEDSILFIGSKVDVMNYHSMFDLFFLASREEPFGIVAMEAALFETPVLCFADSGGMPGFVGDDCGVVVPYVDIAAAVRTVIRLAGDREVVDRMGLCAKEKVYAEHTLEAKSDELITIIKKML